MLNFKDLPKALQTIALTYFEWRPEWNAVQINYSDDITAPIIQGLQAPLSEICGLGDVAFTRCEVDYARLVHNIQERPRTQSDEEYQWELYEKKCSPIYDKKPRDAVNSPDHYTQGGIECIEAQYKEMVCAGKWGDYNNLKPDCEGVNQ